VRPDGTRVVSYRNGTVKEVHADGEVRILFSNGDVKQQMPVHSCAAAQRLVVAEAKQLAVSSQALGGAVLGGAGLSPLLTADIPAAVLASLKLGESSSSSSSGNSSSGKDAEAAAAALFATLSTPAPKSSTTTTSTATTTSTTGTTSSPEVVVVYWYGQARTRHTTFPSGIEVYEFPNGQVSNESHVYIYVYMMTTWCIILRYYMHAHCTGGTPLPQRREADLFRRRNNQGYICIGDAGVI
jgi:hypothetical protein